MRAAGHRSAMRVLGGVVLSVFLFGFTSGPLRTCLSHPGHAPAQQSTDVAHDHMATHHGHGSSHEESAPHREHEGCSCLGQCSLEHPHYLPAARMPAPADAPMVPRALRAHTGLLVTQRVWRALPLARPPPAVV